MHTIRNTIALWRSKYHILLVFDTEAERQELLDLLVKKEIK